MKTIGKSNLLFQLAVLAAVITIMVLKTGFAIILAIPVAMFVANLVNLPVFHVSQSTFEVATLMPFSPNIDVLLANVHKIEINADYTMRVDVHMKDGSTLSKTVGFNKANLEELREALATTGVPVIITGKRA